MERDVFPDRRGSDHPGQQTIGPSLGSPAVGSTVATPPQTASAFLHARDRARPLSRDQLGLRPLGSLKTANYRAFFMGRSVIGEVPAFAGMLLAGRGAFGVMSFF